MSTAAARTTAALRDLDRRHHLHPFTNHLRLAARGARIISGADGAHIRDSDGNRYLDFMAGLWCVNIGYGRTELAEAAHQQMLQLPYYNSFFQTAQVPAVELAEALAEVTPAQYKRAFFGCTGSDANDTIVRLARYYWQVRGQAQRRIIISRRNAYHGSTMAGASLGGMQTMHAQGGLPIPGIEHIEQPYYFGRDDQYADLSEDDFGRAAAQALQDKIEELGAERVAAFIGEPIQGAGGVIIPPSTYWPAIQRICKKYDILLIVDEVICGFGRTGRWFGSDTFAIEGDLMTLAKGLSSGYQPVSAVMVSDRVAEALDAHDGEFSHGYTYSGHPVACAVALKNIQILRDERIIDNACERAMDYLRDALQSLADHPLVGEVRCRGFIGAIELVADKAGGRRFDPPGKAGTLCRDACFDNGLVMRAVGDTMVLSPPLIISRADIDEFADKARAGLDHTRRQLAG
ncbi:MAG: aspartate aminotransferase family protein [Gammaproteobacteria bacterium]|nr:aspartate aminotransferase family protein [Gammaproteobacteria bacterium]MDD9874301.1 aspartate aminotransferase family protein [Gammaproteobacteria bacterium]